jgi:hypothetical protein
MKDIEERGITGMSLEEFEVQAPDLYPLMKKGFYKATGNEYNPYTDTTIVRTPLPKPDSVKPERYMGIIRGGRAKIPPGTDTAALLREKQIYFDTVHLAPSDDTLSYRKQTDSSVSKPPRTYEPPEPRRPLQVITYSDTLKAFPERKRRALTPRDTTAALPPKRGPMHFDPEQVRSPEWDSMLAHPELLPEEWDTLGTHPEH